MPTFPYFNSGFMPEEIADANRWREQEMNSTQMLDLMVKAGYDASKPHPECFRDFNYTKLAEMFTLDHRTTEAPDQRSGQGSAEDAALAQARALESMAATEEADIDFLLEEMQESAGKREAIRSFRKQIIMVAASSVCDHQSAISEPQEAVVSNLQAGSEASSGFGPQPGCDDCRNYDACKKAGRCLEYDLPLSPSPSAHGEGVVDLEYKLPCTVRLPPATSISKGCKLGTLIASLKIREYFPAEFATPSQPGIELREALERVFDGLSIRLNNVLCEMKPDYDDSVTGFNEAWDIMRKYMKDQIDRATLTKATEGAVVPAADRGTP